MPSRSPGWRLELLGRPRLVAPDGRVVPCERKTAALLAYLAFEGPTSRARLVTLLWPGTPVATGKNNLLHLLRRLRGACGADVTKAGDPLSLTDGLTTDVNALTDENAARALPTNALLDGVDFDACPDLHEWLLARRELADARRAHAYRAGAHRHEQQGAWADAITLTERLLVLDPLGEDTHRTLMRLHYHNGDRPAALRAYHRCKSVLQRELNAEPSTDTARLARQIDQGTLPAADDTVSVTPPTQLPVSVLRPPTLLGREAAWAQLEDAWTAGKLIYLTGDPGVGKTRLAQDFVRSKGR
ncbi:BTAD domain-containing putative transcriptional regulator, partial [Deinococcus pimensis]|uniref:BTAD domain-containing putative transcriptional regulator n=1 Tax=Deinococcus pimensis TaxID=309888 RepID=UPI0024815831